MNIKTLLNIGFLLISLGVSATSAGQTSNAPSSVAGGYRVLFNDKVVSQDHLDNASSLELSIDYPKDAPLDRVTRREFSYLSGEQKVQMDIDGTISCAVQFLSPDEPKWGTPVYQELSFSQIKTKLPFENIEVPTKIEKVEKVDNNNFKAYKYNNKFNNWDSNYLYFKPSQDCKVQLYYLHEDSRLESITGEKQLYAGEVTELFTGYTGYDILALFYDTPINRSNSENDFDIDIMLLNNKVPTPKINFNEENWDLSITCADKRATIYYSLDGSFPSIEYTGPVKLKENALIKAYAVLDGMEDSDLDESNQSSLALPIPELKYVGGPGMNQFIFTNAVEGVTTYYTLGDYSVDDDTYRIKFDGNPFEVDFETVSVIHAYSEKENLNRSSEKRFDIDRNNYITPTPYLQQTDTRGNDEPPYQDEEGNWISDPRKEYFLLYVYDGTRAYYRIVPGKEESTNSDNIVESEWTHCNVNGSEWIELGDCNSGNHTIQVYAESDDRARSEVKNIYTDWVRAKKPTFTYDNYKVKLSTDVPGGIIKFRGYYNSEETAKIYTAEEYPDGIDVKDESILVAYVEAEGFSRSDLVEIHRDSYNIASPIIEYQKDGYLHIFVEDEKSNLFVTTEPWQNTEKVGSDKHVRFIPEPNTVVTAYATKWGYNNSSVSERNPIQKPSVSIDGYRVNIWHPYAEVFYTTNGEKPIREITETNFFYKGSFELENAAQIRAVAFADNEIPAEADFAQVLDQAEMPQVEFNFSANREEDGSLKVKKVRLTCPTPGAKIWYSLDRGLSESSKQLYEADWEGIDVTGIDYIYAYTEAEGYRDSEQMMRYTNDGYLNSPNIRIEDGVLTISHDDKTVDIKPTFRVETEDYPYIPEDVEITKDEENNKLIYNVSNLRYNTIVKAHVEKQGYVSSDDVEILPISKPEIHVDGNRVNIDYYWNEIYYTLDGEMPTKDSPRYEGEFETPACTVRAVRFDSDRIPSEATPVKVLDRAEAPKFTFNYQMVAENADSQTPETGNESENTEEGDEHSDETVADASADNTQKLVESKKIQITSNTPNAKIWYCFNSNFDGDSKLPYPNDWAGIDVGNNPYLYAYVEADGYRDSEVVMIETNNGYLSAPRIEMVDSVIHIWHDDKSVKIVPKFRVDSQEWAYTPEDLVYVQNEETNEVTCTVKYNTVVSAHVEKWGYFTSNENEKFPISSPTISVDGYNVYIDPSWAEIYYTLDGTLPTKESTRFDGSWFEAPACTVRAVRFDYSEIPSEAEAKVLDRTETPLLTFNFDKSKDQKKVNLSCNTPNAKIYYTLDRSLNEDNRKEYNPSEGIDVAGYSYIYAYAEADGYRRSEEMSRYLEDGILRSPNIEVKNDGKIVISHDDPSVTIVPTFFDGKEYYTPADYAYTHNEESNIITATVRPNTVVKAYSNMWGYYDSSESERSPYYIPTINVDGYYVWIDNYYGEVFYTLDGSAPTKESKYYEGGFDATPCTVRAVCFIDGEIPGEATPAKVMDPAQSPVAVFNYSTQIVEGEEGTEPEEVTVKKIKFTCPTPNAKIYYSVGRNINDGTKTLYDPETLTDGVDVADYNYVYAYAEAEGYRRSETVSISTGDGYLSVPDIQITDGVVEIWHNDPTVTIVPVFTPAQQYEYVKDGTTNKVTCKVLYNTTVKAHVEKDGCFASEEVERGSLDQPTIEINGNNVYINHYWRDEVYYTLDGSTPTKESQRFDDNWFEVDPCTIKAVAFRDGEIPAESDPAVVLPQVATPKVVYNFDRSKTQRKVKFSCDTQNAKIYYTLNKGITDQNRETYDPSSDGVDVTDISYVYFYAEADGFRRSVESEQYIGDAYLGTPEIMVTGDGVIEIRHSDPSVKIVPTFTAGTETYTPENLVYTQDEETNKITATVKYNTVVKAHVEKEGYYSSDDNQYDPLPQPIINVDGYYVWFDNNYGEIYYTLDGSMPTRKSSYYDGGFNATAGTVRAVCFWEGSIPSEATPASVHAQAETPQVVFNFSRTEVDGEVKDVKKVKFASATPNAKIYYSTDAPLNTNTRKLYDPVANPDGIDVSEISYVYAQATADDYRDSEISERVYMSEGLLNTPDISISNGVVTISHYDPSVTIVPVITPVQEYAYDHNATNNKITFNVAYNSSIKAYVTKTGYLDSDQVSASYVDKPIINVSDYYVDIDTHGYDYYTYYTTDGTLPTTESIPYTGGFESNACTIRAAILIDGYIPMEADQAKVMDPAVTPVIEIDNGFAKISTSTPGATIWYVTDVNISNANRKAYNPAELPNGIDLSSVRTINTYAEAEGYRRSETLNFEKNNFLLSAPSLSYSNGYVSAEVYDDNVAVKFTDGNGKELTPEANNALSVKIPYNTVVNAYTYKKGYLNSSSVQMKCTDAPTITADLFKITIKGKSGQTLHYTTDGSTPTAASKEYEGPFYVTESCKVRAVAFVDNLIPAEGQSIDIAYRKSLKPEVQSYDGRYLTLSAENGSTIKYVKGSDTDIAQGTSAQGKIDLEGINVIKAIAHRDDADDSEVFTFTPEYYANETDVYTSKAGLIKKAFDWCPDKSIYTSLNVHGVVIGSETEDNGDYAFLRALPELRHLDLTDVTDAAIPDSAFASKKLISVVLPTSFKTVGEKLFGEDNTTLCAVEIPGDGFVPETLLEGVKNPNLLLYLKNKNSASELLDKVSDVIKNVVVLGSLNSSNRAENVVLTHANAFYAPKEFNAQKISFTRSFTKETQIGGFGSGWETMVLPFDVQSVSCASKVLKPFGEADTERGECPFWLFRAADVDWDSETAIFANTPYLLAFPNNPLYADEYVVNGDVVFSSNNANVPVTPVEDDMMFGFGMGRYIVGNYETISKEEDVLAINDEVYNYHNTDFQPGGIFVSKQKDVVPFECFVWTESGASGIPVFEQSAIDGVLYETGVKVWSESYDIYIYSGIAMKARIYDSVGQLIRSVDVKAGETVRVQDITPGIYFVGNTKILVKK